ncbi:MAG: potassium channel protein [Microthrixaceae bacterium]
MTPQRRLAVALGLVTGAILLGFVGYTVLGFGPVDSIYQTIITISTVGFNEVDDFDTAEKAFTILLIVVGFASVVFAVGQIVEFVVEGHLSRTVGRRRMDRNISHLSEHVVLCGWGRVGQSFAEHLRDTHDLVVVDNDPARLASCPYPYVLGDATDDGVLAASGVQRCAKMIAALATDADNLFVVLSGRSLNEGAFIVARARVDSTAEKMIRAGADRVVNPHELGGSRMAALVGQPHVAEFVDVVMHESGIEFQLAEVALPSDSPLVGRSLGESHLRANTGALVLAMRNTDGTFVTNPSSDIALQDGQIMIAIGTESQLDELRAAADPAGL